MKVIPRWAFEGRSGSLNSHSRKSPSQMPAGTKALGPPGDHISCCSGPGTCRKRVSRSRGQDACLHRGETGPVRGASPHSSPAWLCRGGDSVPVPPRRELPLRVEPYLLEVSELLRGSARVRPRLLPPDPMRFPASCLLCPLCLSPTHPSPCAGTEFTSGWLSFLC